VRVRVKCRTIPAWNSFSFRYSFSFYYKKCEIGFRMRMRMGMRLGWVPPKSQKGYKTKKPPTFWRLLQCFLTDCLITKMKHSTGG